MILLLSVLLGLFLLIRWAGKGHLHSAFLPGVTVSAISCLVCLGGLLGRLEIAESILTGLGLVSFVSFSFREVWRSIHGKRADDWRDLGWILGCFILLFAGCALWTRNQFLYSYDDFSHWGRVAKILATSRRLPAASDGIAFPSYPLGSAAFIDFCCFLLGGKENHFLFAQSVMTFSFLLSLQSCIGGKSARRVLILVLVALLMCYHHSINTLSVDHLLGAAFLAALLLFLHHRKNGREALPFLMLMLAGLVMIKNSGLFLAIMILGFLLIYAVRTRERVSPVWAWVLLPIFMYAAWHLHVRNSFASFGKHYMSLSLYYANLRGNLAGLGLILRIILPRMISPASNYALWLIPAFALMYFLSPPRSRPECRRLMGMAASIFLLYEAGTLMMYVCSMDVGEVLAHQGDDYARYNSTMILGLLGMAIYLLRRICAFLEWKKDPYRVGLAVLSATIVGGMIAAGVRLPRTAEENRIMYPDPYAFSEVMKELPLLRTDRVIILSRESNDDGYVYYLAAYYLPGSRFAIYQDETAAKEDHAIHPEDLWINLLNGTWTEAEDVGQARIYTRERIRFPNQSSPRGIYIHVGALPSANSNVN